MWQTPQFVGERDAILFAGADDANADRLAARAHFVLQQEAQDRSCLARADEFLTFLEHAPVQQAIDILDRLTRLRGERDLESALDLGIAYALLGDYERSIVTLRQAIDEQGEQRCPDAHYHLGRVLFEEGHDLEGAISALRLALKCAAGDARVNYYLGQALRTQAHSNILAQAAQALQVYLDQGAPLGQQEEIKEFIRLRESR